MFVFGICDDEVHIREKIKEECNHYMFGNDIEYGFREFTSGNQCLEEIKKDDSCVIDLLFLDIEMPGMDGLEIRDLLVDCINVKKIIFVSSHRESVLDAFGLKTVGFVTKPINQEILRKNIDKVVSLFVKQSVLDLGTTGSEGVPLDEIIYMEAEGNYTRIYISNPKEKIALNSELVSIKLGHLEKKENSKKLLRVHKSYLVNQDYIYQFKDKIILKNGITVPVGRTYKKNAKEQYAKYMLRKLEERI